jgi:hypothetical protein
MLEAHVARIRESSDENSLYGRALEALTAECASDTRPSQRVGQEASNAGARSPSLAGCAHQRRHLRRGHRIVEGRKGPPCLAQPAIHAYGAVVYRNEDSPTNCP